MIELMVIIEMLIIDSGEDCRRGVNDKEEKKVYCIYVCFFVIVLVIVLCVVVSVLYENNIDFDF